MFARLRAKHPGSNLPHLLFWEFARAVALVFARVCYDYRAYHADRVPATGPLLIVANHQSHLDPPFITLKVTQRHLDFVARVGLFKFGPFAKLIGLLNALPIREDGGGGGTGAIKETLRRLEQGKAVVIFPEGSRTRDGSIGPFKRGVALLVKKAGCPVVPAAIEGAFDAWPRTRKFPRLWGAHARVMYGVPIPHEELMKDGADAALERLKSEIEGMRAQLKNRRRK